MESDNNTKDMTDLAGPYKSKEAPKYFMERNAIIEISVQSPVNFPHDAFNTVAIKEWQEFQKDVHKMVTKKVRSWYAELQKRVEARGNIRYFTTEEKEILDKQ
jgi:hypothetical protein